MYVAFLVTFPFVELNRQEQSLVLTSAHDSDGKTEQIERMDRYNGSCQEKLSSAVLVCMGIRNLSGVCCKKSLDLELSFDTQLPDYYSNLFSYKERGRFAFSLLAPVSKHIAYFTHILYTASLVPTQVG